MLDFLSGLWIEIVCFLEDVLDYIMGLICDFFDLLRMILGVAIYAVSCTLILKLCVFLWRVL